jgi:type IV secretory pathway TrbL component
MALLVRILLTLGTLLAAGAAHAADPPSFPLDQAFTMMQTFADTMVANVSTALGTAQVTQVVNVLFTALALSFFVWKFAGFAMRGFDLMDILEVMLTIMFVFVLLTGYQAIFPPIFSAGRFVADAIGNGIIGAPPGASISQSLMTMFANMSFQPVCTGFDCFGAGIVSIIATVMGWVCVILLGIIAVLVDLWTVWGFTIAFAIGWVTIPFLLYERLSFLFEGWLKFFFGVVVYAIVAKANLALVFVSIQMFLGSSGMFGSKSTAGIKVSGLFDIVGLLVFVTMGIFALASTGRFASAIVMGAGGGGIGGVVQGAARAAAGAAGNAAGAIAGAMKK